MRIPLFSLISLIPVCIIFLSCCIFGVSGQCLDDQQSLLLQLKNNLIFDHAKSTKLAWWNGSVDCCSWEGVTCQDGRVIGLDLTDEAISGGLKSSGLFSLQYLKNLSLAYNDFSSSMIPSEFEKLTHLVYLNLSTAGFSGQVPVAISNLTKLVILDLSTFSNNDLSLKSPNLYMLVQNLSELIELHLDGVTISAQRNEWCQALSSSLPKLKVLSLSSCNLFGPFHPSILMLKSLTAIRLNSNYFLSPIPEFFANFTNLTYLDLGDSRLNGTFPQKIFQIPTLETLDLSLNSLLQGSLPDFPQNGSLRILNLRDTKFSGTIPHTIANLRMLSKLDFMSCNFNGSIPYSMASLTQLVSLDMSLNSLTGPIPSFNMAKNLTQINLSGNQLTGHITSTQWEELHHLVSLDLSANLLNGSIPISLFSLPSLQELQLHYNQFSGQLNESHKVSSLPLCAIDLGHNNLEGPIPMFIFKLQSLLFLTLSSNNFNGSLELKVIQQLRNLSYVGLSCNNLLIEYDEISTSSSSFPHLTGIGLGSCKLKRFPNFLRNNSKLQFLDLSNNQIVGNIPSWIGKFSDLIYLNLSFNYLMTLEGPFSNLSSLTYLDLHSNQLQGELLVLVPNGNSIEFLDFSMNNFHSIIPNTIGNLLRETYFFSLSSNKLYGHIPRSICNASYLEALDFSSNFFSGPIPRCLIEMSRTLAVVNLRKNNIFGPIPNYFPRNCVLQTLNLNENQIEGRLPKSLVNCTNLEILDLGYNKFEDTFPCYLRNASMLRVLIMRSNRFYGNIFCPNLNATWPMLQIIDGGVNKFTGRLLTISSWTALMGDKIVTQPKLSYLYFISYNINFNYQYSITVIIKGQDRELVKILTIFTLIDFSCNHLDGPIPQEIGKLTSLHLLNLSHNAFQGQIPSSLRRLSNLESLDLSSNKLAGKIPLQLADGLNFLEVLNLSFNQLVGPIPYVKQFKTFSETSFEGNKGLCGFPLKTGCNGNMLPPSATPKSQDIGSTTLLRFDQLFIPISLGFLAGAAWNVVILMFWQTGRRWCNESVDKILMWFDA